MDFRRIFPSDLPHLRRRWWLLIACTAGPVVLAAWIVDSAQFAVVVSVVAFLSLMLLGLGVDVWLTRQFQANHNDAGLLLSGNTTLLANTLTDPVSGALSRAALDRLLAELSTPNDQSKAALALIMIDIDGFKTINDHHGHPAGDAVLRACAARWRAMLRKSDWLCRYGGDEFCVLLPGTELHQAKVVAHKLMQASRELIHVTDHAQRSIGVELTISLGISAWEPSDAIAATALLATADRMLYQSKAAGGNQVTAVLAKETIHG
ncbi:MAG: GGDEF domain-containing protein [Burkholderiaceae bacterium]|nr:GGDEF domain-containing protein [Burkholderiaceae bacterium]